MEKIVNSRKMLIGCVFTILVIILKASPIRFSKEGLNKTNNKLILLPTLSHSSIDLDTIRGMSYFVKLKIDTITMNSIKYIDNSKQKFMYEENECYISQLFDLSDLNSLLKVKVISFSITTNFKYEPRYVSSNSEYLTVEQLNYMKSCVRTHISRHISDTLKFYVSDIRMSNEFNRYAKWSFRRSILNSFDLNLK